jgi:hypothetical protein
LEKLEELRNRGLISEEYYQQKRNQLLSLYLENRERRTYKYQRTLPRKLYLIIGIIATTIIIGFITSTVIGYSNASSLKIASVELERLAHDSLSVNVILYNPTAYQANILRCLYEFKSEGSTLYNGELRDVRLPPKRSEVLTLDIPMKTPRTKNYLSKVADSGLLEGELEISCEVPVLLFGTIQTPILVPIHENKKIRTPELGKKITITNKNLDKFQRVIGIIPENFNLTRQYILTIEVRTMNTISIKEEGIEGVLVDLKGVLRQMDWTDKELSLITDFLEEATPHLRLIFEGTYRDTFEIILPKNIMVVDVQVLRGNLLSYFVNMARNSVVLNLDFVRIAGQQSIADIYGRIEVLIIFSR